MCPRCRVPKYPQIGAGHHRARGDGIIALNLDDLSATWTVIDRQRIGACRKAKGGPTAGIEGPDRDAMQEGPLVTIQPILKARRKERAREKERRKEPTQQWE